MRKIALLILAVSSILMSCVDDPQPICKTDPRSPFLGSYSMTDSVFFLGSFNEVRTYEMIILTDSLQGDSIIMENIFNTDFGLDLIALIDENGDFVIPSQDDETSSVSGNGFIAGDLLEYQASYADGGFSFRGMGVKN